MTDIYFQLPFIEIESRSTMRKNAAYKEIEKAILEAIWLNNEAPVLSSLNSLTEPQLICAEAQVQIKYLHQLMRSLEMNIHYH